MVIIEPGSAPIKGLITQCEELLSNRRVMLCMGDRVALAGFCLSSPIRPVLCAAATTESDGLSVAIKTQPDTLIATDDLEQGYGISLVISIKNKIPDIKVVMIIRRETKEVVQESLDAGCDGVIFASSLGTGDGDFLDALSSSTSDSIFYPESVRNLIEKDDVESNIQLTDREIDVMKLLMRGKKNSEISDGLNISGETVKSHISNIISKLGVNDRTQAAIYGLTKNIPGLS